MGGRDRLKGCALISKRAVGVMGGINGLYYSSFKGRQIVCPGGTGSMRERRYAGSQYWALVEKEGEVYTHKG